MSILNLITANISNLRILKNTLDPVNLWFASPLWLIKLFIFFMFQPGCLENINCYSSSSEGSGPHVSGRTYNLWQEQRAYAQHGSL